MKKYLSIFLTIMNISNAVGSSKAHASENKIREKIMAGVNFILAMPQLPLVKDPNREVKLNERALTEGTLAVFDQLQSSLFQEKSKYFVLKSYWGAAAACDVEGRIVYLNPLFEEALKSVVPADEFKTILALILAHEMGHYFYEANVVFSPQQTSPLGNPYYIGNSTVSNERSNLMHGEVDAIGIYIATVAGFDTSLSRKTVGYVDQAIRYMTKNLIGLTEEEMSQRLIIINDYLR